MDKFNIFLIYEDGTIVKNYSTCDFMLDSDFYVTNNQDIYFEKFNLGIIIGWALKSSNGMIFSGYLTKKENIVDTSSIVTFRKNSIKIKLQPSNELKLKLEDING